MNALKGVLGLVAIAALSPSLAFAQEAAAAGSDRGMFALAAAIVLGVAAAAGTYSQGIAVSAALESIGRNPGAAGSLFTPMMLGLAFIESLVVLAFVIAFFLLPS